MTRRIQVDGGGRLRVALLTLLIAAAPGIAAPQFSTTPTVDPATLFLTWQGDPMRTMTAQWLSPAAGAEEPVVWVAPMGRDDWRKATGSHHPFPLTDLVVNRVEMTGLEPGTIYRFHVGTDSPEYTFRTAPATAAEPVRFVTGGDAGPWPPTEQMNAEAAKRDPLFGLIGGDIAYANAKDTRWWVEFLEIWKRAMVSPGGHLIPMVVAIGNHETRGGDFADPRDRAPLFLALFGRFAEKTYDVIDFGDYMSILLLDTGHVFPVDGDQTAWLKHAIEPRKDRPHLFAVYHVPAYPSHRNYDDRTNRDIREHWLPLFDAFSLDAAFENHDHTYKRTPLLRGGKPHPEGVLYLGDGCWGRTPRPNHPAEDTWYLVRSESINHVILTTVHGNQRNYEMIDVNGNVFDSSPLPDITLALSDPAIAGSRSARLFLADRPIALRAEAKAEGNFGKRLSRVDGAVSIETKDGRSVEKLGRVGTVVGPPMEVDTMDREIKLPAGTYRVAVTGEATFADGSGKQAFRYLDAAGFDVIDMPLRPADSAEGLKPGLAYRYYEGDWERLPDFASLTPAKTGETTGFIVKLKQRDDDFALVFEGFIDVPHDGPYRFFTHSDDGSQLMIGDTLVVDNDGQHTAQERSGDIALAKGKHPIRVEFFDAEKDEVLEVRYAGPTVKKTKLPASALFHKE